MQLVTPDENYGRPNYLIPFPNALALYLGFACNFGPQITVSSTSEIVIKMDFSLIPIFLLLCRHISSISNLNEEEFVVMTVAPQNKLTEKNKTLDDLGNNIKYTL